MDRGDQKFDCNTETTRDTTSSENSKNSLNILRVSMAFALVAAISLFWYFGIFSSTYSPTTDIG
jgi:hypothetical protein